MKIRISKRDLDQGLQVCSSSVATSGDDITTHYLFRVREGKVEVLAYNGRLFACIPLVGTEIEGTESFTIDGSRLRQWLGATSDDATLTITLEEKPKLHVSVTTGRSTGNFQTLNPSVFPYFDGLLAQAKLTATLPAVRLRDALEHAKAFVSNQETTSPELCVIEALDGVLRATDKKAIAFVKVDALDASTLRVHVKDTAGIIGFLGMAGTGDIEILEDDKAQFLRRPSDGAIYGETRFAAKFPSIVLDRDVADHYTWTLSKNALVKAIQQVTATGDSKDERLIIQWPKNQGPISLQVRDTAGKTSTSEVDLQASTTATDAPALPTEGFPVHYKALLKTLGTQPEDTVNIGLVRMPKGGYLRFKENCGGNDFLSVVAWKL